MAALGSEDWCDAIHAGVFSDSRPTATLCRRNSPVPTPTSNLPGPPFPPSIPEPPKQDQGGETGGDTDERSTRRKSPVRNATLSSPPHNATLTSLRVCVRVLTHAPLFLLFLLSPPLPSPKRRVPAVYAACESRGSACAQPLTRLSTFASTARCSARRP